MSAPKCGSAGGGRSSSGGCSRCQRLRNSVMACVGGDSEQRQVFDDTSQRAALLQILSGIGGEESVDPVVAVLDDVVAEHGSDPLECLLCLLACIGDGAFVCGMVRHVALDVRPE